MQSPSQTDDNPLNCPPIIRERHGLIYAGFWPRFFAKLIDWAICGLIISVFHVSESYDNSVIIVSNHFNFLFFSFIKWCIPALYTVIFLVNYNATPGKMAFSLKVISKNQKQLSYGIALARYLMEIISAFIFFLGYMISIFDAQKRTLHDRICHTYVVKPARMVCHPNESGEYIDHVMAFEQDESHLTNKIYGLHSVLFSLLVLESLFLGAICLTDDVFFRMIRWALSSVIATILFFALVKQRNSSFAISVRRLTWATTFYYCVLTPVIYFMLFIICFEQFLHELPVIVDDPIIFIMQAIMTFMNVFFLSSFTKLMITIIFILCSFVLGMWGIILVSTISNSYPRKESLQV
ncbi:RDD domain containing protein [Candidatus Magnetomorum sp. HK-1]|nr:RDD domain containing protein [Candidatus Magnetomorum sp. HK-1]